MSDVAYIFPGQGAQYVGMGKELYETYPEAKQVFDKASEILKINLTKLCFEGPKDELLITSNCSIAIVTHSIAALRVFEREILKQSPNSKPALKDVSSLNPEPALKDVSNAGSGLVHITPKYTFGLSLGEYSCLIAAGCLTFEEGIKLVRKRGELMDMAAEKNPGKMASIIGMTIEQVEELCKGIGGCEIANLNCPGQIVVSGKTANIELLAGLAKDKGAKRAIMLDVSGAFHSSLMLPAKERLEKEIQKLTFNTPNYPIISNVTANPAQDPAEIKANIVEQVNKRTLFEASVRYVISQGIKTYIEFGPGTVLKGLLRKIDDSLETINIEKPEHLQSLFPPS